MVEESPVRHDATERVRRDNRNLRGRPDRLLQLSRTYRAKSVYTIEQR